MIAPVDISADPILYAVYDNFNEEFLQAYTSQREAEDAARDRNDEYFNDYSRYASDEDRYTVDQLPRPYESWAVS